MPNVFRVKENKLLCMASSHGYIIIVMYVIRTTTIFQKI